MDRLFSNIIVGTDNILQSAVFMEEHIKSYQNIKNDEEKKSLDANSRGEFYSKKYVEATITYSIEFDNNETVSKTNEFDWFKDTLLSNVQNIKGVSMHFYAYMDDSSESVSVDFDEKRIDMYSDSKNLGGNNLAHRIESYLDSLPTRYNDLVKNQEKRKLMPSFSISFGIGIVISLIFFILAKCGVFGFSFSKVLLGLVSTSILLGLTFLVGMIVPSKNRRLYLNNFVIEKYYAGHDSNYNSIYRDDIEKYKNECEVCIGKNMAMPVVRMEIEKNYKNSLKVLYVELAISALLIILFFVI